MLSKKVAVEHNNKNSDNLVKIEWFISKRCNFHCSYCDKHTHDHVSSFPDLDTMKATLDKIMSTTDKKIRLSFTGGEPTICKHLFDFCKYGKEKYGDRINQFSITTNGSRTKKYYVELSQYVNSMIFSYHMEYHDVEKIPDSVYAVHEEGNLQHLHVHMMMLPSVFDKADKQIDEFRKRGIAVSIRRIRPAYREDNKEMRLPFDNDKKVASINLTGSDGRPDYSGDKGYYTDEELNYLKNIPVSDFKNVIAHEVNDNYEVSNRETNVNEFTVAKNNQYLGWYCWAGIQSLRIEPSGDVWNATCRTKKLGNIFKEFTMISKPEPCIRNWCACAADLNTTKVKDLIYGDLVRVGHEL
jgi:sulfatase maturation enzyme AslB (radical SAM superfamily)